MPDLLDGGPPWLVHAEIGEKIVKVGNLALATDKSRDAPLVIFLEHGKSRFFSECAPANLRAELSLMLFYFFSFFVQVGSTTRSEEHTSELQSLIRISYAVFCLKKKNTKCN